jgi:hypothetical protein
MPDSDQPSASVEAGRMVIGPAMNLIGYRMLPAWLAGDLSICERCWSVVPRFHQEDHDRWHATQ